MLSSIRSIISLFLILIPILVLIPHPTSSLTIISLKRATDRNFLAFGPRGMDAMIIFDIAFHLAVFFTLFGTWLWIIKRTIAIQVITRISWLLVTPIAIAQRLSLYFTTLLRVVTTPFLNAARRSPTPPRAPTGGLSRPVSSAPRFQVQWARQRGGPAMRGSARRMGNIPISLASTV